jgi:hypothetical protein
MRGFIGGHLHKDSIQPYITCIQRRGLFEKRAFKKAVEIKNAYFLRTEY